MYLKHLQQKNSDRGVKLDRNYSILRRVFLKNFFSYIVDFSSV